MPAGGLACRHVAHDALCERICCRVLAVVEGADQVRLVDQDILRAVIGYPLKECLCLVYIAFAVNSPEARRTCDDGVNAIFERIGSKAHLPSCVVSAADNGAVDPVTLGNECVLACRKACYLVVICAVDQKCGIGVLVHHADESSEVVHSRFVDLAAVIEKVNVGGVILCKTCVEVLREYVCTGRPAEVCGLCAPAEDCCDSELVLHAVDLLDCCRPCCGACQCSGINAGLLKDLCVVCKSGSFYRVREADGAHLRVNQFIIGVVCPRLTGKISQQAVPVCRLVRFDDENVGHVVCLVHLLELVGCVCVAADGLDVDNLAGLFLVLGCQLCQLVMDLGLAVQKADAFAACCSCAISCLGCLGCLGCLSLCRRVRACGRRAAACHQAHSHCSCECCC